LQDFLGIVWHGEASLRNGKMQGITSVYRNGDADFTYDSLNLTVSAQMALLALKVNNSKLKINFSEI
jgi:Group 7 allergen